MKAPAPTVVFNNPFDSFHNTVAEAKEEREQLDRLLTISTPRERMLVAGIALLLCILVAWLFFGSVARNLTLDGVLVALVAPGEGTASVSVLGWIDSDVASEIEAGMPVVIDFGTPRSNELAMTDGEELDGKVAKIAALPLYEGMAAAAPVSPHHIEIALDGHLLAPASRGRECRIVIELGRQAPVALFGMRRP